MSVTDVVKADGSVFLHPYLGLAKESRSPYEVALVQLQASRDHRLHPRPGVSQAKTNTQLHKLDEEVSDILKSYACIALECTDP